MLLVKQKRRYRIKKKGGGLAEAWPADAPPVEVVAAEAVYIGSAEHKSRPIHESYNLDARLRSDAAKCDPSIDRETAQSTLRRGIKQLCVSATFTGGFPEYVWARLEGAVYLARLTNRTKGEYKGYRLDPIEYPTDRAGRLAPEAWVDSDA
jgi:hypothetical protein